MDGVLVDTAKHHFRAWHRMAATLSIPFTEEQNEELKGVSRVDSLEKILSWGNLVLDNHKKHELMEIKNKWYLEYVNEIKSSDMLPGTQRFLSELKVAHIKLGLGSSSKNSMLILDKLGLRDLFDSIVDGNKIHFSKPHPEVFLKAAQELNVHPSEAVVFEDAVSGVDAAKAGGFYCVGIGRKEVLANADFVIGSLNEINLEKLKVEITSS